MLAALGDEGRNMTPSTTPMGAVIANKIHKITGKMRVVREPEGKVDIRIPSDSPSKSWWKTSAVKSVATGWLGMTDCGKMVQMDERKHTEVSPIRDG